MAQGKLFANVENKFIGESFETIEVLTREALIRFFEPFRNSNIDANMLLTVDLVAAKIGAAGDGKLHNNEKALLENLLDSDELGLPVNEYLGILQQPITSSDYELINKIIEIGDASVATALLDISLGFAFIDGEIEADVEKELERIYTPYLMQEFFNSDMESVPDPVRKLRGLEGEIATALEEDENLCFAKDIYQRFNMHAEQVVDQAIENLESAGVIAITDTYVGKMIGLTGIPFKVLNDDPVADSDVSVSSKTTASSKTSNISASASETARIAEKILKQMKSGKMYTASDIQRDLALEGENVSNDQITKSINVLLNTGYIRRVGSGGIFELA